MTASPSIGLRHLTLMNGSKVAAIPCGRTTIAQSNCRQLIGLRPGLTGFASSIKRQRIQLNRTASIGPGSLPLLAKRNGRRCMKSSHLTMVAGVRFELTTFGLCDLTQLSLRVGLYLHPV